MTKREIVLRIADETDMKQVDVMLVVQRTLDLIVESLTGGDKVELRNFGVFKIRTRKPKRGRNPRTGQEVPVPERRVVVFKPGMVMKSKVKSKA
ncbi:MAG: HU family DNA-binding protein [Candidatus Omnitrophota bacterium]